MRTLLRALQSSSERTEEDPSVLSANSQLEISCWKGWSVGCYAHAWLPETGHGDFNKMRAWRKYRVLIVKILKDEQAGVKFVVAPLQDRRSAVRRAKSLETPSSWMALASLLRWPRDCQFVLQDQVEIVDACGISTWHRKCSTSLATHWTIGTRTGRLKRWWYRAIEDGVDTALKANVSFETFLQLPRELRDMIYSYALFDEHQMTTESRIYVRATSSKKQHAVNRSSKLNPSMGVTWQVLPSFQSPAIMKVSKQIRREALEVICSTKLLVITVDRASATPTSSEEQPPWMIMFACVRFDMVLHEETAEAICESFQQVSVMLSRFVRTLRSLEIRIRYPRKPASAATVEHGSALLLTAEDVAKGICELRGVTDVLNEWTASRQAHMAQIEWGVTSEAKHLGDYLCNDMYLAADFPKGLWHEVANGSGERAHQSLTLSEEDCRDFGCCLHGK